MRKEVIQADFHPSVSEWTYEKFADFYKDQLTPDEVAKFAAKLGIKKKSPVPSSSGDQNKKD